MKKYLRLVILIILGTINHGCKTASKDAVDIKFNLAKGSKYEYSMSVNMNMNEKVTDKTVNAENTMNFTYIFEVVSDSAGWKMLLSTIAEFSMDVNSMGHKMHFGTEGSGDTAGPMAIMSKVFSAMKGAQFSFTVNDNGEIGKISGVRE